MSKHEEFILTPISSIIKEGLRASFGIGLGLEAYPVSEYVMQSIFLKMTGFQEQKLRCIAWEIATNDYNYRRILLSDADKLGEYSNYRSKNTIYKRLIDAIKVFDKQFDINKHIKRESILNETISEIKNMLEDTNLSLWNQRKFQYFLKNNFTNKEQFMNNDGLFKEIPSCKQMPKEPTEPSKDASEQEKKKYEDKVSKYQNDLKLYLNNIHYNLKSKYEELYQNRNRIAHNAQSYQKNLPSLSKLEIEDDESRNYYIWFTVLCLIDRVFVELYKIFSLQLEENSI